MYQLKTHIFKKMNLWIQILNSFSFLSQKKRSTQWTWCLQHKPAYFYITVVWLPTCTKLFLGTLREHKWKSAKMLNHEALYTSLTLEKVVDRGALGHTVHVMWSCSPSLSQGRNALQYRKAVYTFCQMFWVCPFELLHLLSVTFWVYIWAVLTLPWASWSWFQAAAYTLGSDYHLLPVHFLCPRMWITFAKTDRYVHVKQYASWGHSVSQKLTVQSMSLFCKEPNSLVFFSPSGQRTSNWKCDN